jgi:hypothetical protein
MKLSEHSWWSKQWRTKDGETITPDQIRQGGILETCRLLPDGLIIEVELNGKRGSGRICQRNVNATNLDNLKNFLLDYCETQWQWLKIWTLHPIILELIRRSAGLKNPHSHKNLIKGRSSVWPLVYGRAA